MLTMQGKRTEDGVVKRVVSETLYWCTSPGRAGFALSLYNLSIWHSVASFVFTGEIGSSQGDGTASGPTSSRDVSQLPSTRPPTPPQRRIRVT